MQLRKGWRVYRKTRHDWYIKLTTVDLVQGESTFSFRCDGRIGKFLVQLYEGHLESKERFAIQRYLLIIGKKQNMQVLSYTFTYFST